jgi:UDP:flavonoid glycosyltransferase YjiC (YdhE family)
MIIPKQFLFVDWEGGGNLSPALTVVRHLVAAGHHVRFLEEPCNQEEIEATGSAFVSYVQAPQRTTKAPVDDFVRDWDSRTPLAAFARTRERLLFGPARACAQDVLTELQAHPAVALALNIILYGAMIAAEKAGVPTALLATSGYQIPTPGLPPPHLGVLPARGPGYFPLTGGNTAGARLTCQFSQFLLLAG